MDLKNIKKIDMHAHARLFPNLAPDYPFLHPTIMSDAENIDMYDKMNIEAGVLQPIIDMAGQPQLMTNESCIIMSQRSGGRLMWFMNISPYASFNRADDDLTYLFEHYIKLGAKGFGEITTNIYADDPKMDNLFSFIAQYNLPATIHMQTGFDGGYGIVDELHLPRLEKMLKKHKNLKIIGHSPVFWSEISGDNTDETRRRYNKTPVKEGGALIRLMREYENLYVDLSGDSGCVAMMRDRDFAAKFMNEFADRIFYACDVCSTVNTFQYTFAEYIENMVHDGYLSLENYIKIVRNNAANVLGLSEYKL